MAVALTGLLGLTVTGGLGFLFLSAHFAYREVLGPSLAALATGLSALALAALGAACWRWRLARKRRAGTRPDLASEGSRGDPAKGERGGESEDGLELLADAVRRYPVVSMAAAAVAGVLCMRDPALLRVIVEAVKPRG